MNAALANAIDRLGKQGCSAEAMHLGMASESLLPVYAAAGVTYVAVAAPSALLPDHLGDLTPEGLECEIVPVGLGAAPGIGILNLYNMMSVSSVGEPTDTLRSLFPNLRRTRRRDVDLDSFAGLVERLSRRAMTDALLVATVPGAESALIDGLAASDPKGRFRHVILQAGADVFHEGALDMNQCIARLTAAGYDPVFRIDEDPEFPVVCFSFERLRLDLDAARKAEAEAKARHEETAAALASARAEAEALRKDGVVAAGRLDETLKALRTAQDEAKALVLVRDTARKAEAEAKARHEETAAALAAARAEAEALRKDGVDAAGRLDETLKALRTAQDEAKALVLVRDTARKAEAEAKAGHEETAAALVAARAEAEALRKDGAETASRLDEMLRALRTAQDEAKTRAQHLDAARKAEAEVKARREETAAALVAARAEAEALRKDGVETASRLDEMLRALKTAQDEAKALVVVRDTARKAEAEAKARHEETAAALAGARAEAEALRKDGAETASRLDETLRALKTAQDEAKALVVVRDTARKAEAEAKASEENATKQLAEQNAIYTKTVFNLRRQANELETALATERKKATALREDLLQLSAQMELLRELMQMGNASHLGRKTKHLRESSKS